MRILKCLKLIFSGETFSNQKKDQSYSCVAQSPECKEGRRQSSEHRERRRSSVQAKTQPLRDQTVSENFEKIDSYNRCCVAESSSQKQRRKSLMQENTQPSKDRDEYLLNPPNSSVGTNMNGIGLHSAVEPALTVKNPVRRRAASTTTQLMDADESAEFRNNVVKTLTQQPQSFAEIDALVLQRLQKQLCQGILVTRHLKESQPEQVILGCNPEFNAITVRSPQKKRRFSVGSSSKKEHKVSPLLRTAVGILAGHDPDPDFPGLRGTSVLRNSCPFLARSMAIIWENHSIHVEFESEKASFEFTESVRLWKNVLH